MNPTSENTDPAPNQEAWNPYLDRSEKTMGQVVTEGYQRQQNESRQNGTAWSPKVEGIGSGGPPQSGPAPAPARGTGVPGIQFGGAGGNSAAVRADGAQRNNAVTRPNGAVRPDGAIRRDAVERGKS